MKNKSSAQVAIETPKISQTTQNGHNINGNNNTIYGGNQPQIESIQQSIRDIQAKLDLILTALINKRK